MNKLQYKNGLLYTSIEFKFKEKSVFIEDVIIDTGASHTIIATEYLEEIDAPLLDADELVKTTGYGGVVYYSIRKKLDEIKCGNLVLKDIKLDFGVIDPKNRVNGLIGLDFLIGVGTVIDPVDLTMYERKL